MMLEDLAIHGRSILQRLSAQVELTPAQRDDLPAAERVTTSEAGGWERAVRDAAAAHSSGYPTERIGFAMDALNSDIEADRGDAVVRLRDYYGALLAVVEDMAGRPSGDSHSKAPSPSPSPATNEAPMEGDDDDRDVFLSHASEDKEFVLQLSDALRRAGVSVWVDHADIEWGDSIRQNVEEGLRRCRYAVVVLSEHYFAKKWTHIELDALWSREINTGERAILPVWLGLEAEDVWRLSPMLGSRRVASASEGVEEIAQRVAEFVRSGSARSPAGAAAAPSSGGHPDGSATVRTGPALRFVAPGEVDEISVRAVVMEHSSGDTPQIEWPADSDALLENLVSAYEAAIGRRSWFGDASDDLIASFLRTVRSPAMSRVDSIEERRRGVATRLPCMLDAMADYGWSIDDRVVAASRFARLSDIELHSPIAYYLSHSSVRDDLLPSSWAEWLPSGTRHDVFRRVFEVDPDEELWTAYVPRMAGFEFGVSSNELLLLFPEAVAKDVAAPDLYLGSAWYELIIPQVEMHLVGRTDTVHYDETMQIRKWRNPNGKDYTSPAAYDY